MASDATCSWQVRRVTPGLRSGTGLHWIFTYLPRPALYVPPQRGTFALSGSVRNNGSFPVTIEAVYPPPGAPLAAVGPVRYLGPGDVNVPTRTGPPVLRSVVLGPSQAIEVGMPLRVRGQADPHSHSSARAVRGPEFAPDRSLRINGVDDIVRMPTRQRLGRF